MEQAKLKDRQILPPRKFNEAPDFYMVRRSCLIDQGFDFALLTAVQKEKFSAVAFLLCVGWFAISAAETTTRFTEIQSRYKVQSPFSSPLTHRRICRSGIVFGTCWS